ncbi:MAG: hypothetical protein WCC06_05845 [Candidatus Aminicenantales bacterium]
MMRRKGLIILGSILVFFAMHSCKSRPEESLLKRYFNAITLKDVTTMSTIAIDPISIEFDDWQITNVSEEKIEAATLPEMDQKEQALKKKMDEHVTPTLDAQDALNLAKAELSDARTAAARAAARKKVEETQAKYDEERQIHNDYIKEYNEAKSSAAKEEEITTFSLGAGELPNVRELNGDVHSKEVEVEIKIKEGETKKYKFYLRMFNLRDEVLNLNRRGRWVIVKTEQIS